MTAPHLAASVILCVRNAAATLEDQLEALTRQSLEAGWEVIVVDNGSTDRSRQIATQFVDRLPRLRIVNAFEKAGLSYARNVGASAAAGDVLAFCDADDRVEPGWLEALVLACQRYDIVGGALDVSSNDLDAQHWRGHPSGLPPQHRYLPHVIGANFAMRRDAYSAVGGCDEDFLACWDDVDLSWRAARAGCDVGFTEKAVVDYRLRSSIRGLARQTHSYGRAEVLLYTKHRPDFLPPRLRDVGPVYWFLLSRWHHVFRGRRRRGRWIALAAGHLGRLRGSLHHRVWFP